jgi:menaquinol-cytochrome c reductase iron-sulfur subunit
MEEGKKLGRRDFLAIATTAIGGVIGAALAIPAVAYIVGPALRSSTNEDWIRLGSTAKMELGTPTLFKATIQQQSGWIVNEQEISVYVLTEDNRDYIAMSNICTHLGCRVRWISDEQQFFCPCHNAVFAKDGVVVSGPPPGPLNRFEVKVEEDQLYILGG